MSKHTPGPWSQSKINSHSVWADDCKVAETFNVVQAESYRKPSSDERLANARLISAAPELLQALDDAMDMLGSRLIKDTFGYEWHEKAIAAIAKAKGDQP